MDTLLSHYRNFEIIREGIYGVVHKAVGRQNNRVVVIKSTKTEPADERVLREVTSLN